MIEKQEFDRWMNDFTNLAPPNGESFQQLYNRVVEFYHDAIVDKDYESVAIITHGGVIRSIINHVLGIPLSKAFSYELDFGSVTLIDKGGGWAKVKYLNR